MLDRVAHVNAVDARKNIASAIKQESRALRSANVLTGNALSEVINRSELVSSYLHIS